MKLTRDNAGLLIILAGAVLTFLIANFGLMTNSFPGIDPAWKSRIELASGVIAVVSAYLRLSPLPLDHTSDVAKMPDKGPSQTLGIMGGVPAEQKREDQK